MAISTAFRWHVAQPSSAASSSTVSVRVPHPGSRTPSQFAGTSPCATPMPDADDKRHLVSGFHSRGVLPHLKREGGTYFVTFRQAGTLPRELLLRFKAERQFILSHALAAKRPLTWQEEEDLFRWYSERVDRYLDCCHGECHLRRPSCADVIANALHFFDRQRYELHAWVVMPNHVHVVLWPKPRHTLSDILHTWKSYNRS